MSICVLLLLVFVADAAYPQARRRPAPGPPSREMEYSINVGSHRLYIRCKGNGRPNVVIEAGLARTSEEWRGIQDALAPTTRVCVYDRAALGRSDTPFGDRRSAQLSVTELQVLLGRAGVGRPYVLVGHSFGGVIVRLFAARNPKDVAGMVLVDSSHEGESERIRALLTPDQIFQQERRRLESGPMTGPEPMDLDASFAAAREYRWTGDIPLLVLVRGTPRDAEFPPEWTAEQRTQAAKIFRELQQELAARSKKGKLVVVEGAGHDIHKDKPAAVIGAIKEVLAALRD